MSILSNSEEQELIDIKIFYKETSGPRKKIIILKEKDEIEKARRENKIKEVNTKWKDQTWHVSNLITQKSKSYDNISGEQKFDMIKYKDNILKECLVEWDIKDDNGEIVPVNAENIDKLPVSFANELLLKYDNAIYAYDEEEQKK